MNKKGTHVDWVISMGIFIVYVFALFILLRPGIKPVHRPVTLLNVLEEGFREEVMWTVKVVPLFIRKCSGGDADGYSSVTVRDTGPNWDLGGVKDMNGEDESKTLECGYELDWKTSSKSNPFYFYFNGDEDYTFEVSFNCKSQTPATDCIADLGVIEDIEGINPGLLNGITSENIEDYNILHEKWEIPEGKEFAILKETGTSSKVIGVKPDSQANVFVRKITTQTVDQYGNTEPISIYLQVW